MAVRPGMQGRTWFGQGLVYDEVYQFLQDISILDKPTEKKSADGPGAGQTPLAGWFNRLVQSGKSDHETKCNGSHGGLSCPPVSLSLLGNFHPTPAIEMLRGERGDHGCQAKARLLIVTGSPVQPHERYASVGHLECRAASGILVSRRRRRRPRKGPRRTWRAAQAAGGRFPSSTAAGAAPARRSSTSSGSSSARASLERRGRGRRRRWRRSRGCCVAPWGRGRPRPPRPRRQLRLHRGRRGRLAGCPQPAGHGAGPSGGEGQAARPQPRAATAVQGEHSGTRALDRGLRGRDGRAARQHAGPGSARDGDYDGRLRAIIRESLRQHPFAVTMFVGTVRKGKKAGSSRAHEEE